MSVAKSSTERASLSSFATTRTCAVPLSSAVNAVASAGRRLVVLPLATSWAISASVQPRRSDSALIAARRASRPRPESPCSCVLTLT